MQLVATIALQQEHELNSGSVSVEFACSPCVLIGFLQVLLEKTHVSSQESKKKPFGLKGASELSLHQRVSMNGCTSLVVTFSDGLVLPYIEYTVYI